MSVHARVIFRVNILDLQGNQLQAGYQSMHASPRTKIVTKHFTTYHAWTVHHSFAQQDPQLPMWCSTAKSDMHFQTAPLSVASAQTVPIDADSTRFYMPVELLQNICIHRYILDFNIFGACLA